MLPWWTTLPPSETLLATERWPAVPGDEEIELRVTADERFRVLLVARTRDAVRACFETYVTTHPAVRAVRLVDADDQPVASLVVGASGARWIG
jgi:hypothetical protein